VIVEDWKTVLKGKRMQKIIDMQKKFQNWLNETGRKVASHPNMPSVISNRIERGIYFSEWFQSAGETALANQAQQRVKELKE
jgi:hypothetical protein